jgi:hypothetical protein
MLNITSFLSVSKFSNYYLLVGFFNRNFGRIFLINVSYEIFNEISFNLVGSSAEIFNQPKI